jgi:hypothetical protein
MPSLTVYDRARAGAAGKQLLAETDEKRTDLSELRALCADLRVLNKKDFKTLLKWRLAIVDKRKAAKYAAAKAAGSGSEDEEDEEAKEALDEEKMFLEMKEIKARCRGALPSPVQPSLTRQPAACDTRERHHEEKSMPCLKESALLIPHFQNYDYDHFGRFPEKGVFRVSPPQPCGHRHR